MSPGIHVPCTDLLMFFDNTYIKACVQTVKNVMMKMSSPPPPPTSRFKGVTWHKGDSRWQARIQTAKKLTFLGAFGDEHEAARAYDVAAVELGRPVNFPVAGSVERAAVKGGRGGASRFKGLSWHKAYKKWEVKIKKNGKSISLGYFDDEEDAARCYDADAVSFGRALNFPALDDSAPRAPPVEASSKKRARSDEPTPAAPARTVPDNKKCSV